MLPDLGKYAFAVIGSYAVAALLLALLIGVTWYQRVRMKAQLAEAEARARKEMNHGQ